MTLGELVRNTVLTVAALAAGSVGAAEFVQSRAPEPARSSVVPAAPVKRLTQDLPAPRHPSGRVSWQLPSAEYVLPAVSPETVVSVANLDSVERTVWLYVGDVAVDETRPTQVTIPAGATRTVTGLAGTAYVHTTGDPSLVQLEARTVTDETSMVVPAGGFLPTGAHARLPVAEAGQGLILGTTRNPAVFNVAYQYSSGTPIESFSVALDAYSTFTTADVFDHLTAAPVVDGQLVVIPNNARTFIYGDRVEPESGDRSLWRAQTGDAAPEEFILPEVNRQTTTVPFARYTSLDTINPDQAPFQVEYTLNLHEVDTPGSSLLLNGTQLYALSHNRWDDAVLEFFNWPASQGDITGSSFGSQAIPILTWTEAYTMLPSGKVGAVIPPLPVDEPCSPDYECSVIGLDDGSVLGVYNLSPLTTTTQLDGFDATGAFTGTTTVVLGQYENTRLADISDTLGGATRALLRVQDSGAHGEHIDEIVAWATRDTATGDIDYHSVVRIPTRENHAPVFHGVDIDSDGDLELYDLNGDYVVDSAIAATTLDPYPAVGTMVFTDPDNDPMTYRWFDVDHPNVGLPAGFTANGPSFEYLPQVPGDVTMACEAEDVRGASSTVWVLFVTPS